MSEATPVSPPSVAPSTPPGRKGFGVTLAGLLCAAALAVGGCAFEVTERSFLFPRDHAEPTALLVPCERDNVEIQVAEGVTIRGWALTSPSNHRWVIWFYGNSQTVMKTEHQQDALARTFRANVVAVDYRGYGFSDGQPTIEGIGQDGVAVFDYVSGHLARGQPIIVVGHSLGTIPALFVASRRPVAGTVLMGTVTSAQDALDMLVHTIPWWQRMWINVKLAPALRDLRPTTGEMFAQIDGPLLVIHGTDDELFPIEHARSLIQLSPSPRKKFCAIEHGTHQDSVPSSVSTRPCLAEFAHSVGASP